MRIPALTFFKVFGLVVLLGGILAFAPPSLTYAACGDTLEVAEACDDGNTNSGDGCSDSCTIEAGYRCVGTTVSECSNFVIFDNGLRRFGSGDSVSDEGDEGTPSYTPNEDSVDALTGGLRQPFLFNTDVSEWFTLTYNDYSLDSAVGIGGDGSDIWNDNGTILVNEEYSPTIDTSGFIYYPDSPHAGYGEITTTGVMSNFGQNLEVENIYTLLDNSSYMRTVTTFTNNGATPITNLRYRVGTQDDYIGTNDDPDKTRGKIVDSEFVAINDEGDNSNALKIQSDDTVVLFYTTNPIADVYSILEDYDDFEDSIIPTDPRTADIMILDDDSAYALYVRLADLLPGESVAFTRYYAAGPLSQINQVINDVTTGAALDSGTPTIVSPTNGSELPVQPVTVSGVATPNAVIKIYNDLNVEVGTGTANGAGQYSISVPTPSLGMHTYSVTATQSGGLESVPTSVSFTITTTAVVPQRSGGKASSISPSMLAVVVPEEETSEPIETETEVEIENETSESENDPNAPIVSVEVENDAGGQDSVQEICTPIIVNSSSLDISPDMSSEFLNALALFWKHGLTRYNTVEGFDPMRQVRRDEAAKILSSFAINVLCRVPDYTRQVSYIDTENMDPTLVDSVTLAYQLSIMKGNAEGGFNPSGFISKEELSAVLVRMMIQGFMDESGTGGKARYSEYVRTVMDKGLTGGFDADGSTELTREEIARMFYRAYIGNMFVLAE